MCFCSAQSLFPMLLDFRGFLCLSPDSKMLPFRGQTKQAAPGQGENTNLGVSVNGDTSVLRSYVSPIIRGKNGRNVYAAPYCDRM